MMMPSHRATISTPCRVAVPCPKLSRQGRARPDGARLIAAGKPGSHHGRDRCLCRSDVHALGAARDGLRLTLTHRGSVGARTNIDCSHELRLHILVFGLRLTRYY